MGAGANAETRPGVRVAAFASGLKHPRWLHVLPNGDVLVAEAASEPAKSWWPRTLVQRVFCDLLEAGYSATGQVTSESLR